MADYSFICYAHENGRFARRLARHLRRHGVVVWFDQWELTQQDEWDNAIEGAIRSCRNFVIILSPASINSWVVREQFRLAKQANRSIVPVLRQPCELPPDLLATSPFDFSIGNYHVALQQLTAKLSNRQMPPKVKASLVWNDLVQTRLRSLSSLLWSGWLGLLLLLLLAAAGSWLF